MHTKFNTIGLVVRKEMQSHLSTISQVTSALERHADVLVHCLDFDAQSSGLATTSIQTLVDQSDLVISLGGDGTLLTAARALVNKDTPLLGVNMGRLGFLADVTIGDFESHLEEVMEGKYTVEKRFFIEGEIHSPDRVKSRDIALNDIILHNYKSLSMIEYEVYLDGKLIHKQRADGVIVTTPTGSTAYALSGGGPIMHPSLETLAIVPICPHTLSNRPIVLPAHQNIEILLSHPDSAAKINYDGRSTVKMTTEEKIRINRYPRPLTLLHPQNYDYFEMLRAKLSWSAHY